MAINASQRVAQGTLTGNGSTEAVKVTNFVTLSAHYDAGTGTMTWEFQGPDGVWRSIYEGATEQTFTGSHMKNIYFADDVLVRGTVSGATGLTLDYQLMSNYFNRN